MSLEHWQAFLQSGALASCPTADGRRYDKEIESDWARFFAAPPKGARILDVGTGNGPVLLIAKQTSLKEGLNLELHGTDRADIDPERFVADSGDQFQNITFYPSSPTEQLPFEDGVFDAVIGQYALEYGVGDKSVSEIARVLKGNGVTRFVVHHESSIVVANARESSEYARWILNELQVYRRLEQFLHMERIKSPQTDKGYARLEKVGRQMYDQLRLSPNSHILRVTLEAVQNFLDKRYQLSATTLTSELKTKWQTLELALARMQDLLSHACSTEDISNYERYALSSGLEIRARTLQYHDENLVGWVLEWRRNGE